MVTYSTIEIGSIVYNLVEGISSGISGLLINGFLPEQSLNRVSNYTGDAISVSAIPAAYQPAILYFTVSQVLSQLEAQGLGTKSVKIGELSIAKGMVEGTSQSYEQMGMKELNDLGHKTSYYTTFN